jgi:hypothetical protein
MIDLIDHVNIPINHLKVKKNIYYPCNDLLMNLPVLRKSRINKRKQDEKCEAWNIIIVRCQKKMIRTANKACPDSDQRISVNFLVTTSPSAVSRQMYTPEGTRLPCSSRPSQTAVWDPDGMKPDARVLIC